MVETPFTKLSTRAVSQSPGASVPRLRDHRPDSPSGGLAVRFSGRGESGQSFPVSGFRILSETRLLGGIVPLGGGGDSDRVGGGGSRGGKSSGRQSCGGAEGRLETEPASFTRGAGFYCRSGSHTCHRPRGLFSCVRAFLVMRVSGMNRGESHSN